MGTPEDVSFSLEEKGRSKMTIPELVKMIAEYIADNAERESIFSTPCPGWKIDAHALLDYIVKVSMVSEEQLGLWVDNIVEGKE